MNTTDFTKLKPCEYSRKSSESEDKQMLSIISQKEENEKTKKYYGLSEFVKRFEESKSAKAEFKRESFNEMMRDIEIGKIDCIVCWKLDRLARNMTEGGKIIDLLSSGKIKAIITHDKVYYPSDNVLMLAVEFGMGKQYVKDLSVNVKRGQHKKAELGLPHGVATLGFLNDRTEEKGNRKWLIDKERLPKLRQLFKEFLTGNYSGGKLYQYAIKDLKLTTVERKRSGGNLITLSRIYKILTDPVYAGFFFYDNERYELDRSLPRLITEDEHNRIKRILAGKNIPKTQNHEPLFTGFCFSPNGEFIGQDIKTQVICDCRNKFAYANKDCCPKCGTPISEIKNPKYLEYEYYYNVSMKKKRQRVKSISKEKIQEEIIKNLVPYLSFSDELINWCQNNIKELKDKEVKETINLMEANKIRKEKLEKEKENLLSLVSRNVISEEDYSKRKITIESELEHLANPNNFNDWFSKANEILDTAREIEDVMLNGTRRDKRSVLRSIGSNLIWNEEKLSILTNKPVSLLIETIKSVMSENDWFEPKSALVNKEQIEAFTSIRPIMLPLVDKFRTLNWTAIKRELEFSKIFEMLSMTTLQN